MLTVFLLSSAILRAALSATQAFAQSSPALASKDEAIKSDISKEETPSKYLEALIEREERVNTLGLELSKQREANSRIKYEIERRLVTLEEAEKKLSATLSRANTAAETDIQKLIDVYENMKPKETAALFETMEPAFAAGFLGRMQPESAAGVMAGLSPQVAYSISAILAGRNSKAPGD